jgi:hypothetical protein
VSTTASQAFAAIRARLTAADSGVAIPLRWQGENGDPLPNPPAAFAFVDFNNDGSGRGPTAFGGGPGSNLYRNEARVEAYVFVPNNDGLAAALDFGETIAARLRSFRDADISCFSASVIPIGSASTISLPGFSTGVGGDYQCVVSEVRFHFDLIG